MDTLRELLEEALKENGEEFSDLIRLNYSGFTLDGDLAYNGTADRFTAWSEKYVYVLIKYDSYWYCRGIPRHPDDTTAIDVLP